MIRKQGTLRDEQLMMKVHLGNRHLQKKGTLRKYSLCLEYLPHNHCPSRRWGAALFCHSMLLGALGCPFMYLLVGCWASICPRSGCWVVVCTKTLCTQSPTHLSMFCPQPVTQPPARSARVLIFLCVQHSQPPCVFRKHGPVKCS